VVWEPRPTRGIRLFHTRPPIDIAADCVYFAFASGRFTYDCITCNAQCCRGHGYQATVGPELDRQLALRPALRFFLDQQNGESPSQRIIRNCPPACFLFTELGRCRSPCGALDLMRSLRLVDCFLSINYGASRSTSSFAPPAAVSLQVEPPGTTSNKSTYAELLEVISVAGRQRGNPAVHHYRS
jgi:hypothetical protein